MPGRKILSEAVRSIDGYLITSSYQNLGAALTEPALIITLKNTTDKTLFISEDGVNDHYELPAGTADSVDITAASREHRMGAKPKGTQFEVKGVSGDLPTSGKIILQVQYV